MLQIGGEELHDVLETVREAVEGKKEGDADENPSNSSPTAEILAALSAVWLFICARLRTTEVRIVLLLLIPYLLWKVSPR